MISLLTDLRSCQSHSDCRPLLKAHRATNAPRFNKIVRTLASVKVPSLCRLVISLSCGCLHRPGDGVTSVYFGAWEVGVDGERAGAELTLESWLVVLSRSAEDIAMENSVF